MVGLYLVKTGQYVSIRTEESATSNGIPTANESFISGGGVFRVHRVEAHTAYIEWRGEDDWYTEIDELDNAIKVEERAAI